MTPSRGKLVSIVDDTKQSVDENSEAIRITERIKTTVVDIPITSAEALRPLYASRDFCEKSYKKHLTDSHQTIKKTGAWRSIAAVLIAPWVWWSRING